MHCSIVRIQNTCIGCANSTMFVLLVLTQLLHICLAVQYHMVVTCVMWSTVCAFHWWQWDTNRSWGQRRSTSRPKIYGDKESKSLSMESVI